MSQHSFAWPTLPYVQHAPMTQSFGVYGFRNRDPAYRVLEMNPMSLIDAVWASELVISTIIIEKMTSSAVLHLFASCTLIATHFIAIHLGSHRVNKLIPSSLLVSIICDVQLNVCLCTAASTSLFL